MGNLLPNTFYNSGSHGGGEEEREKCKEVGVDKLEKEEEEEEEEEE